MREEMELQDKFMDFLCANFMVVEEDIDKDVSLIDQGVIDSFGLIEIAAFIEQETGTKVAEEQMNRDNFGSYNKILAFIDRILGN